MLDGSNATPVIRDFTLGAAAAHHVGDLLKIQSDDGYVDQVTTSTSEVTVVCMEEVAAADITAGTTQAKCAIITSNQVWKCSMSGVTAIKQGIGTVDTTDCNTLDHDATSGGIHLLDGTALDDDSYTLAYVVFSDTTFGNA